VLCSCANAARLVIDNKVMVIKQSSLSRFVRFIPVVGFMMSPRVNQ
jgi:hypothetical protein